MQAIQNAFRNCFPESTDKIGLHSFRKAAYKIACYMGAEMDTSQYDARHKRSDEAVLYRGDAMTHVNLNKTNPIPENSVSKYQPCRLADRPPARSHAGRSLPDLAKHFVENLPLKEGLVRNVSNLRSLLAAARAFQWKETSVDSEFLQKIKDYPEPQREELSDMYYRGKEEGRAQTEVRLRAELAHVERQGTGRRLAFSAAERRSRARTTTCVRSWRYSCK
jgi:hypothetical protein